MIGPSYLVKLNLNTTLSALPFVMHVVVLGLGSSITSEPGNTSTHSALNAVTDALSQICQLTLSFQALSLQVLIATLLLEALIADETANSLLCAASSLVPFALSTIVAVFCYSTGGADGEGASFGSGMGEVRLCFRFAFVLVCLGLDDVSLELRKAVRFLPDHQHCQ